MEHRRWTRIPIPGNLGGDITVPLPLVVTQISAGGALVETKQPLRLESRHEIRLVIDGVTLALDGRVVHSRVINLEPDHLTYEAGLEFIQPGPEALALIQALLTRLGADDAPA